MFRVAILITVLASLFALAPQLPARDRPTTLASFRTSATAPAELAGALLAPDRHLDRFFDRYLWFVPRASGHKASLGIGFFLLATLFFMFAGRMAGLDSATFGRCAAMVSGVSTAGLIQYAVTPGGVPFVAAVLVIDLIVWFAIVRGLFGADLVGGAIMLIFVIFSVLVSLLTLEVLGFCLQQADII